MEYPSFKYTRFIASHFLKSAMLTDFHPFIVALFRHGKFKDSNLNESIVEPFTKAIAKAWAETFNELTFEREGSQLLSLVEELLLEIEQTAALGMQDRIRARSDSCLEEARGVMQDKLTRISASMGDRQKESSRSMAQSIQEGLSDGYEDIRQTRRRGPGSATKEKVSSATQVLIISGLR